LDKIIVLLSALKIFLIKRIEPIKKTKIRKYQMGTARCLCSLLKGIIAMAKAGEYL
jgi:hypothetical protein